MKTYRGAGIAFFRQKDGRHEVFLGKRKHNPGKCKFLPAMRNELNEAEIPAIGLRVGMGVLAAVEQFDRIIQRS